MKTSAHYSSSRTKKGEKKRGSVLSLLASTLPLRPPPPPRSTLYVMLYACIERTQVCTYDDDDCAVTRKKG